MIDLHCHILPGIDDGPRTIADSVALAHAAHTDGTRTIVATPHVSFNWPDNDAERIADGVLAVREALHDAGIEIELLAGAEVALTRAADPERLAELVSLGARTSVTAGSFTGLYGRVVRRCVWDLLRRGLVHSVASDAHDHVRRPPTLKGALESAGL